MNNILSYARESSYIDKYLPVFKSPDKVPDRERTWNVGMKYTLWFLVSSLIPSEFKKFVMEAVKKNEQQYSDKRKEKIEVTPEFAKLLTESTTFSSYFVII